MLCGEQREFIDDLLRGESYILVEAPAGTGKTFCCIQAADALCNAKMLQPFQKVLVLTFSRNARAQLLKELANIPRESPVHKQIDINNYHSFFKRYIDIYRDILGIQTPMTIVDDEDFMQLLQAYAKENNIALGANFSPEIIDDYYLDSSTLTSLNSASKHKRITDREKKKFLECVSKFTRETEYVCFAQFGSLACQVLSTSTSMAEAISHDYPVLILDEYQDTNYYQEKFISQILRHSKGVFFADKWQMIYAFRGSTMERLSRLPEKYPSLKVITFHEYYRYKDKQDLIDILTAIRNSSAPDYSSLVNGLLITCSVPCNSNWQNVRGKSHKAQCTSFSKKIYFSVVRHVTELLIQKKSVAILCRNNNVANRLSEVFFENNLYPRAVSDTPEMARICKHIKRCIEPVPLKEKVGSVLMISALCTMSKKIDGEDADSLYGLDPYTLSRKRKQMLKSIFSIVKPELDAVDPTVCLDVITSIMALLSKDDNVTLNFARQRYVEHCAKTKELTPTMVDHIMMQRQYIDSFTNICPGLYITTVHQAKGKEFDCVFVVDVDGIAEEASLMYVANSRMKERLYPIRIQYIGVQY